MGFNFLLAALLLAQNGDWPPEQQAWWEKHIYQHELNECAVSMLAEQARNGGLAMDTKSGHGVAVDRVLEECRRTLGEAQEK